ncbi:MAG: glycosyltransferase family 4 protein [Deltaproteobacteria bacterium]|nr:glycosyltransferase family 4 protein [Deltaproteobacteria bacterium]
MVLHPFHIVTFNSHQPYLHLFHSMPVKMDIIQLGDHHRFLQEWSETVRPLPKGWELIDRKEAGRRINAGQYDLALAHNISDYIDFNHHRIAKILLIHVSLTGRMREEKSGINRNDYLSDLRKLISSTGGKLVYISEAKRRDWGLDGDVIPHGIDLADYPDFRGDQPRILRVANNLIERAEILDYDAHRFLTAGFPSTLIGDNPKIQNARRSESWNDLKQLYATHRLYLHTAVPGCEDGFNLAMLEAMATGMPVVSTAHPTSPIQNGVNGFISDDLEYLRRKIDLLLSDREPAIRMGRKARKTVEREFSIRVFRERWEKIFREAAGRGL